MEGRYTAFHHFEMPQNFVDECKRVLKKNGRVYIAEPIFNPLVRVIANTIWVRISKKGDVKVYSEKELKEFFDKARFAKVETYKKGRGIFLEATK
jgi:2-polyprenyl-3-methyl-5-hydroxy-6-metoxy-1,4-benzoquinol methylase